MLNISLQKPYNYGFSLVFQMKMFILKLLERNDYG